MDGFKDIFKIVCSRSGYCIADIELEEAGLTLLFAVMLAVASAREIFVRKLFGRKSELFLLNDDIFDIVVLRIFGIIMLVLVVTTFSWQYDSAQIDVLIYEIVLAVSALSVNNNNKYSGLLFVALSYSSWYGWFRLLMVTPFGTEYHQLLQPQWLAALLGYTAPTLIANLKYPALVDTDMARITYGTVIFGVIVAANACFLLCDSITIYFDLIPNYAPRIIRGEYFRLYGVNVEPLTRLGYYSAMVVLQFITCKIPHLMLNEDALLQQLREQGEERTTRMHKRANKLPTFSKESAPRSGSSTSNILPGKVSISQSDPAEEGEVNDIDLSDVPEDCVEITAEAAIEMQERMIAMQRQAVERDSNLTQRAKSK